MIEKLDKAKIRNPFGFGQDFVNASIVDKINELVDEVNKLKEQK